MRVLGSQASKHLSPLSSKTLMHLEPTSNTNGHNPMAEGLTVVVKDVDELQVVALASHEIVGVVGGGDLHRTCAGRREASHRHMG